MKYTEKYKYMAKKAVENQAKHLIENCSEMDLCIHKINKFLIFKFYSFEVVNSEKLTIECFETEQEALDFCLDRYSGSKISEHQFLIDKLHDAGKDWDADKCEIVDLVWRPKFGDNIWNINQEGNADVWILCRYHYILRLYDFRTKELAEAAIEVLKTLKHF